MHLLQRVFDLSLSLAHAFFIEGDVEPESVVQQLTVELSLLLLAEVGAFGSGSVGMVTETWG